VPYLTSKTFGGASGFSCCYRDHKDEESTLGQLHGSVLAFKIMFEADTLADTRHVNDLMEKISEFLDANFSHTTVIAQDDPSMEAWDQLDDDGAIDLVVLPDTAIETFAKSVFDYCTHWVGDGTGNFGTLTVHSVECREHDGSSAIYARDDTVIELISDDEVIQADKGDGVPS
jgi:6-pyruvoyltetrahydropterin/6-carboxytetrahydropterin synthase